tara:strand:- start:826 stop:1602 length:777 start_codon:yes stop_codon:yes gene_type:complete
MIQDNTAPIFVDGRKYPRFTVLYNLELFSDEVKNMKDATLRVWLLINMTCNQTREEDDREYWCSYARLAECSGRSRSTVYRALKELRELGMIEAKPTQGVNRILLHAPPSLASGMGRAMQKSQICNSGDSSQHNTPDSSPGGARTSSNNISSTSVPRSSLAVNPKDEWRYIGGHYGPEHKAQAFKEEDMAMCCEVWRFQLDGTRVDQKVQDELATLCRNQPEHFVKQMVDLAQANEHTVRFMMSVPGFYDEMFGGDDD